MRDRARLIGQLSSTSGESLATFAPYNGQRLADLPQCTDADVAAAFERARSAQRSWAATAVRDRVKIVLELHDLLLARQDEIMDLIQAENGKSRRDAFLEVADIANTARYYARVARGLLRD
ncbi:MAG: aldehyde dehydrogenase family protein, partial [Actinomycetota bacterium]|nr:aldehyde dehydrogenase family protein [Actinomycetota bacterium]